MSLWLCPLFSSAFWYAGAALSNVSLLHEILLSLAFIDLGICLMTLGGWLESTCTYRGVSFGFLYGACVFSVRSSVTSRKSVVVLSVSTFGEHNLPIKIGRGLHLSKTNHWMKDGGGGEGVVLAEIV